MSPGGAHRIEVLDRHEPVARALHGPAFVLEDLGHDLAHVVIVVDNQEVGHACVFDACRARDCVQASPDSRLRRSSYSLSGR